MESLFAQLVTKEMGFLAAGAIAIMYILGRLPINKQCKLLKDTSLWKNYGIFILAVLCIGGAFLPGVVNIPKADWGAAIIFGCLATLCAHAGKKILQPLILNRIEGTISKVPPPPPTKPAD